MGFGVCGGAHRNNYLPLPNFRCPRALNLTPRNVTLDYLIGPKAEKMKTSLALTKPLVHEISRLLGDRPKHGSKAARSGWARRVLAAAIIEEYRARGLIREEA